MPEEGLIRGYVLHRRPYRESSLLVEMLCEGRGRQGLVARGAARGGRRGCTLEPFTRLRVGWRGRGELAALSRCETGRTLPLSRERLAYGLYLNELGLRLVPRGDALAELYPHYEAALVQLCRGQDPWGALLEFELQLLESLGHPLTLDWVGELGMGLDPQRRYWYRLGEGPSSRAQADAVPLSGALLLALGRPRPVQEAPREELRAFMQALLARLLGGARLTTLSLLGS